MILNYMLSMRCEIMVEEELIHEKIVATFHFKKRSKPLYYYQSELLRYYRPYLVYYKELPKKEILEALSEIEGSSKSKTKKKPEKEELIKFPVRGVDVVVNYAKSLEANVEYAARYLPRLKKTERVPVIIFPGRYSAMRHLIFSITYSTLRSLEKVERLREIINSLNISIIEPFYNTALFRYHELKNNNEHMWHWKVLRIGRAFKIMYMLDR